MSAETPKPLLNKSILITLQRITRYQVGILSVFFAVTAGAGCFGERVAPPTEEDTKEINKHVLSDVPQIKFPSGVKVSDRAQYLGANISVDTIIPGESFQVTHYWKVLKKIGKWNLFTHVDGLDGKNFVNVDHRAVGDRYPARYWQIGEIIEDTHEITLPLKWTATHASILTGLWRGSRRLKVYGESNKTLNDGRLISATLPVTIIKREKPPTINAAYARKGVRIDGKLTESVWKNSPSTAMFKRTLSGTDSPILTSAKFAWSKTHFYVAFVNEDTHIWSTLSERDAHLWTEEAVELFIDSNGDRKGYIEIQINPTGTVFDSHLSGYRNNHDEWNSAVEVKTTIKGTLNDETDEDKGWVVEMAIPWSDIYKDLENASTKHTSSAKAATLAAPSVGTKLFANLFRIERSKADAEMKAVAWSPPYLPDFHKLNRFGSVVLGNSAAFVPGQPNSGRSKKNK